jgi:hypothetical protein
MRKTSRSGPMESVRRPLPEAAAASASDEPHAIGTSLEAQLAELERLSLDDIRLRWRNHWGRLAPANLSRGLLLRVMAYRLQAEAFGDLDRKTVRMLDRLADDAADRFASSGLSTPDSDDSSSAATSPGRQRSDPLVLKPGALLIREWQGRIERVTVVSDGFAWNGAIYASLSAAAFASRARSGTATGSSACGSKTASEPASRATIGTGVIAAKRQALLRAARQTVGVSRRAVSRRHR